MLMSSNPLGISVDVVWPFFVVYFIINFSLATLYMCMMYSGYCPSYIFFYSPSAKLPYSSEISS